MKLYVTYCSRNKREGAYTPDKLYISDRIVCFVERCKSKSANWAIFSALYGFFFPEEKKGKYDVTFKSDKKYWLGIAIIKDKKKLSYAKSKRHILQLTEKMKQQIDNRKIEQIIFYAPFPKRAKCYLGILHYAFDECQKTHGWRELIKHVEAQSKIISVMKSIKSDFN